MNVNIHSEQIYLTYAVKCKVTQMTYTLYLVGVYFFFFHALSIPETNELASFKDEKFGFL